MMIRREFITLLGGAAAAWPLAARAQQRAMPVIGYLSSRTAGSDASLLASFRHGLADVGYAEGRNVAIEYRFADGRYDRIPAMAADLVSRRVAVIAAADSPAAQAVKAATATIPIVFTAPGDPVALGLVASLNRPGGNATGVNFFVAELGSKQLGLLHELLPTATRVGLLVNPNAPPTESVTRDVMAAAARIGLQVDVVEASNSREIETGFGTLVKNRDDALLVGPDAFLLTRRVQLHTLATRHAIPALYNVREYAEVGGLMSYGTSQTEAYHQLGIYIGKVLNGTKPSDLPVMQSSRFELVINLPTARALRLEIPATLLALADELIE